MLSIFLALSFFFIAPILNNSLIEKVVFFFSKSGNAKEFFTPLVQGLHLGIFDYIMHELISFSHSQDLKDYMRQAGEVTYADAHKPRRNEGCVEFASERVRLFSSKINIYFI